MISIRANEKRDIGLDQTGNLALVQDISAIEQNCVTAMSAQIGEMIYAITDGIPTFSSVWDKYTPMLFEAAARKTLKKVEGVLEVESFTQSRQGDVLAYEAVIRTTFGRVTLSNTRL